MDTCYSRRKQKLWRPDGDDATFSARNRKSAATTFRHTDPMADFDKHAPAHNPTPNLPRPQRAGGQQINAQQTNTQQTTRQTSVQLPRPAFAPPLRPTYRPTYRPSEALSGEAVGALPNTVIIGAMKCGTTSLHEYLSYHPEVSMSGRKETNFFVQHQNWSKGLGWYRQHFTKRNLVIGEASPNYARFPVFPGVPERMHMVIPDAKLIYCVRDPVKRMLSHYIHSYSLGRENRPLEQALTEPEYNAYLLCSSYYYQLEQYLKYFDPSQIKLVVLEDLYRDPDSTMRGVFEFLGVDGSYNDERFSTPSKTMPPAAVRRRSPLKNWMVRNNVRGFYWLERNAPWLFGSAIPTPKLSVELREALSERLGPDVAALRAFSGLEFEAWKL